MKLALELYSYGALWWAGALWWHGALWWAGFTVGLGLSGKLPRTTRGSLFEQILIMGIGVALWPVFVIVLIVKIIKANRPTRDPGVIGEFLDAEDGDGEDRQQFVREMPVDQSEIIRLLTEHGDTIRAREILDLQYRLWVARTALTQVLEGKLPVNAGSNEDS